MTANSNTTRADAIIITTPEFDQAQKAYGEIATKLNNVQAEIKMLKKGTSLRGLGKLEKYEADLKAELETAKTNLEAQPQPKYRASGLRVLIIDEIQHIHDSYAKEVEESIARIAKNPTDVKWVMERMIVANEGKRMTEWFLLMVNGEEPKPLGQIISIYNEMKKHSTEKCIQAAAQVRGSDLHNLVEAFEIKWHAEFIQSWYGGWSEIRDAEHKIEQGLVDLES